MTITKFKCLGWILLSNILLFSFGSFHGHGLGLGSIVIYDPQSNIKRTETNWTAKDEYIQNGSIEKIHHASITISQDLKDGVSNKYVIQNEKNRENLNIASLIEDITDSFCTGIMEHTK